MKNSFLVSLALQLFFFSAQAQKLNRTEKKIIKKVELLNTESINFLEKVVNINSGTLNNK
jgi:glutamate carboxypeptidase